MILQCSHPVSPLRPGTQGLIKLGFNTFCLSDQVFKACLLFVLYRKEAAFSWQGECFPGLFWLFYFCFIVGLVFILWKVLRTLTSLPSCLTALSPRRKVRCPVAFVWGNMVHAPETQLRFSPLLSLYSAGLLGSIYPRCRSLLYRQPPKGTTGVAPCQGRSHLCPGNCLLLPEFLI